MKIRTGFVSNSSSSSFICDISGGVESGWDMGLEEAGMYECKNGHTIYEQYVRETDEFRKWLEDEEDDDDHRYNLPAQFCPICSLNHLPDKDMVNYLIKMLGTITQEVTTREEVTQGIKSTFKTYKAFQDYLK